MRTYVWSFYTKYLCIIVLLDSGWLNPWKWYCSVDQFSLVTQSCPAVRHPMDYSTPGFPVHHQLLEFAQTHVHQVGVAIQSSHPLSSPSPPAFDPCQHQVLFNESVLCIRWPKYWSFSFSINPCNEYPGLISLGLTGWISLQCKGLSRVFSNTTLQKHVDREAQM